MLAIDPVDLLALPTGSRLHLGRTAVVEVTGLRNPCTQLDGIQPGLMAATLGRDDRGDVVRRAGVMSVVLVGGGVRAGDAINVELPSKPHRPLVTVAEELKVVRAYLEIERARFGDRLRYDVRADDSAGTWYVSQCGSAARVR